MLLPGEIKVKKFQWEIELKQLQHSCHQCEVSSDKQIDVHVNCSAPASDAYLWSICIAVYQFSLWSDSA